MASSRSNTAVRAVTSSARRMTRVSSPVVQPSDNYRDRILRGDCIEQLKSLPTASVDLVFADPPRSEEHTSELQSH